jgi:hypothetical protein
MQICAQMRKSTLAEIVVAHRYLESNEQIGKIS